MKRLIPLLLAATATAAVTPASATNYIGRINVTVDIFIVTPIPSGDEVGCNAAANGTDGSGLSFHSEQMYLVATQISASPLEYQCVFSIPWEWALTDPSAVNVLVQGGAAYLPIGSTALSGVVRSSTHQFNGTFNLSVSPAAINQAVDLRL
jgi:hypothetical protein